MPEDQSALGDCPDCGTPLTSVHGRLKGSRFLWCWKCEKHQGKTPPRKPYQHPDVKR